MTSSSGAVDAVARLRAHGEARAEAQEYIGADLRGIDLSGVSLSFVNLSEACLDDANLSDSRFTNVLLTGAQLRNARLERAEFSFVEGTRADFSGSVASDSVWRHCSLLLARFNAAQYRNARFANCTLDSATFQDTDLTGGAIVDSGCGSAVFSGARLMNVETIGSSFVNADFRDAERFFLSREILVEILRSSVGRDIELVKLAGAILLMRHWCFAEWKTYLSTPDMEAYYALALEVFGQYEKSGAREALEQGWDWRRRPDNSAG